MPKDMVGRLVRCMYGTRDAGAIWENCYTKCLLDLGFVQGVSSPCCFSNESMGVHVVVHGDDFTALGTPSGLDMYEKGMAETFECKFKGRLGHGPEDLKEMRVLNRIVRVTDSGLRYEADPRHAEMLARALKLESCKHMVTPGVKLPFNDTAVTDDDAPDNMEEDVVVATAMVREKLVHFNEDIETFQVPYQEDIYGRHPREFVFDYHWRTKTAFVSPRRRFRPMSSIRAQIPGDPSSVAYSVMGPHGKLLP